jgi:hypothetical protein
MIKNGMEAIILIIQGGLVWEEFDLEGIDPSLVTAVGPGRNKLLALTWAT